MLGKDYKKAIQPRRFTYNNTGINTVVLVTLYAYSEGKFFSDRYNKLRPFLSNMVANEHSTSEYCIMSGTCLQSMLLTPSKGRTNDNMRGE